MKYIFIIITLFICFSCDTMDYELRIINNSIDTLVFNFFVKDDINSVIPFYHHGDKEWPYIILPKDTMPIGNPAGWREYINACENSQLVLYSFKEEIFENTSWDTIKNNPKLYKKFKLSNNQLDSLNWLFDISQ